jgi:hypothetical protein
MEAFKNTSLLQRNIWIDQKLNPRSPKYNIGGYAVLRSEINPANFIEAIKKVIARNEIFSFSFKEINGLPTYEIKTSLEYSVDFIRYSSEKEALEKVESDFMLSFNLGVDDVMFKIFLIELPNETYIWYAKLHHIIGDGFSFQLLHNEVLHQYQIIVNEDTIALPKESIGYQIYIESELAYRESSRFELDQTFWGQKYLQEPTFIFSKTTKNSFSNQLLVLDSRLTSTLRKVAERDQVSLFHLLLSSFAVVLSKFYQKEEISIGVPILNRGSISEKEIMGPFMNVLPVKSVVDSKGFFHDYIKSIKRELILCYKHRKYPQADILRQLKFNLDRLYDVRFSYEKQEFVDKINSSIVALSNNSEEDPISIHIMDYHDGEIQIRCDINESYISKFEAGQLLRSFKFLLSNIDEDFQKTISEISLIDKDQLDEILKLSTGKKLIHQGQALFIQLWNDAANKYHNRVAVLNETHQLTYAELDLKSTILANILRYKGLKKGDKVVVSLPNSVESII